MFCCRGRHSPVRRAAHIVLSIACCPRHLGANLFAPAIPLLPQLGCWIPTAKPEGQAQSQRDSPACCREQRVHEGRGNANLVDCNDDCERPDGALGNRRLEVGIAQAGSRGRAPDQLCKCICDDAADDEYDESDDKLRQPSQDLAKDLRNGG
jgi:hypothetical protein